jgi:lipopolysaccharide transport system permease protein
MDSDTRKPQNHLAHTFNQSRDEANIPTLIIQSTRGWGSLALREVWEYRDLLYFLLWRDVKGHYRQMALGPLWIVIRPLLNMVLFTFIFGTVAKLPSDEIPYPLFAYSALLPWTFFSSALSGSANSLLSYKDLIAKVYFPRLVVPIVSILSGLVDFAISFFILLAMMIFYGYPLRWTIFIVPLYLLLAAATALAVGLWIASWIVYYRDINEILIYFLRVWMYASPVVYASSLIPKQWRTLYQLNPMTNVIEGFRWALLHVGQPSGFLFLFSTLLVIPVLILGAYHFRLTERTIVDMA